MTEVDTGFLEVLASCTGADGEVDYSDDGWKPADGEYTVLLEKFTTGTNEKGGVVNGTGRAVFRVLTGESSGRSFGEFFWLPSNAKKITPGMSNMLRLATCLCGRELRVEEIGEACHHISENAGSAVLNVRIFSTTSKKDGKVYVNTRFLSLVDEVPEQEPAEATA